jgi:hypothetical protein
LTESKVAYDDDIALLAALASLNEVELGPDRLELLSPLVPPLRQDTTTLRVRAQGLEPHMVFDPRWE